MKVTGFNPGIIRLPSWILNEDELNTIHSAILEVVEESDEPEQTATDQRIIDALQDIEKELQKRGSPITLKT